MYHRRWFSSRLAPPPSRFAGRWFVYHVYLRKGSVFMASNKAQTANVTGWDGGIFFLLGSDYLWLSHSPELTLTAHVLFLLSLTRVTGLKLRWTWSCTRWHLRKPPQLVLLRWSSRAKKLPSVGQIPTLFGSLEWRLSLVARTAAYTGYG